MVHIVSALVITQHSAGVSNINAGGPSSGHAAVKEVAKATRTPLYAPDNTARGYKLSSIEYKEVAPSQHLPGLDKRFVVRMAFVNKNTMTSFSIFQSASNTKTDAGRHMKWVLSQGVFEFSQSPEETFVAIKRGANDVCFVGGLVSEPSAKQLLQRLVLIKP